MENKNDLLKPPPHSKEIECSIIGMMLMDSGVDIVQIVMDRINEDYFYIEAHKVIFRHITILHKQNRSVDLISVCESINRSGELDLVGGRYGVSKTLDNMILSSSVDTHCDLLEEDYIGRELIKLGHHIKITGYDRTVNPVEKIDKAEKSLSRISNRKNAKNYKTISETTVDTLKKLYHLRELGKDITGVPSGYVNLDKETLGWQPTDLIILAARPSVGKTSFALSLARNAAKSGVPVGFFSLEMSSYQLTQRLLSAESEVELHKIKKGKLNDYEIKIINDSAAKVADLPIYIDETPGINIFELRSKVRRMKNKHNIGMVIIDYLQLMNGVSENRNSNREQEVSKISRDLKGLAKELEIPIIALSQMSREVEKRANKLPQLSDLRESGAIEQDADMVIFLYRPSKEDIDRDPSLSGTAMLRIAKHRNGGLEDIAFITNLEIQQWYEPNTGNYSSNTGNWKPVSKPLFND